MFERFTPGARKVIVVAQEDARDLGSAEIGPEHLLTGVLQGAGHELASALREFGLTIEAVRPRPAVSDADAFGSRGHIPFSLPAKEVLELALRETLARNDTELSCEHILLGILRGGDRTAIAVIAEYVDPAQLSAAAVALLDGAA